MRIEIKAYGSGAGTTNEMLEKIDGFIGKQRRVVDTFAAVKQSVHNMNGGVGILQGAVSELDSRIAVEEQKLDNAVKVQTKANDFVALAKRIDTEVAVKVTINKAIFYKKNPWAKPPVPPREKKWYEKAIEAVCEFGDCVADTIHKAGEWIKGHWKSIVKVVVSAVVVVALAAVVVFASPAAAFVAACALIGVGAKLISDGIATAIDYHVNPKKYEGKDGFDVFADTLFSSTINGAATGAANGFGFLYGPAGRWLAGLALEPLAGGITNWANNDYSWKDFGVGLFEGTVDWVFNSATFSVDGGTFSSLLGDGAKETGKTLIKDYLAKNVIKDVIKGTFEDTISNIANIGVRRAMDNIFNTSFFTDNDISLVHFNFGDLGGFKGLKGAFEGGFKGGMKHLGTGFGNFMKSGGIESLKGVLPDWVKNLDRIDFNKINPPMTPVMPTVPVLPPGGFGGFSPINPIQPIPFKPILPGRVDPRMLLI